MAQHLDGATLTRWALRATTGLRNEQATINSLNVFPIPDSDTGTNMARTMEAAVAALEEMDGGAEPSAVDVTTALSLGALRGARGNSGLVLSQFLRALSVAATRGPIDGNALADVLRMGAEYAREAISSPVEGTVITVLEAAAESAGQGDGIEKAVESALQAAKKALDDTPSQLPVLQQAGVVDAGGYGLVLLLRCLHEVCVGADDLAENPTAATVVTQEVEVMFSFEVAEQSDAAEVFGALRAVMEELGNSVVVSPVTETEATMHVHTAAAGPIIEKAFGMGAVSNLRIEVLPEQETAEEAAAPALPIIAMCPNAGEDRGIQELFAGLGVGTALSGAHEVHAVAGSTGSALVLVNGQDVTEFQESAEGIPLEFIDTGSVVGGLAALAVFDEMAEWEDTVEDMLSAVATQRWENIAPAVATDRTQLGDHLIALLDDGGELLTILWDGDEELRQVVSDTVDRLTSQNAEVEVQAIHASGLGVPIQIGVE